MLFSLLSVALILFVPGTLFSFLVTTRITWNSVAIAPAVSIALLSLAGLIIDVLPNISGIAATASVTVILLFVGRRLTKPLRKRASTEDAASTVDGMRSHAWPAMALGLACLQTAATWGHIRHWFTAIPQPYDYLWHQYVVSVIRTRELLGPFTMVPVDGLSEITTTYQYGAHIPAALMAAGGPIPSVGGINATLFISGAVILPLGLLSLQRAYMPGSAWGLLGTAIAASSMYSSFGGLLGLYSLAVAAAFFPGVLAAWHFAARSKFGPNAIVAAMGLAGLLLTHPQAVLALAGVLAIEAMFHLYRALYPVQRAQVVTFLRTSSSITLLGAILTFPWLISDLRTAADVASGAILRPVVLEPQTVLSALALGQHLSLSSAGADSPLFGLASIVATGVIVVRRQNVEVAVAAWTFAGITYVTAAGSPAVRQFVAALWLGDWYRPQAFFAILSALMIGMAISSIVDAHVPTGPPPNIRRALSLALVAILATGSQSHRVLNSSRVQSYYGPWYGRTATAETDADYAMGPLKLEALQALDDVAPDHSRTMNWWPDGSPWMYSVGGNVAVQTYSSTPNNYAMHYLHSHLDELSTDPEVREHLRHLSVCTAFSGEGQVGTTERPAWHLQRELDGFRIYFENRAARVYVVTDRTLAKRCWPAGEPPIGRRSRLEVEPRHSSTDSRTNRPPTQQSSQEVSGSTSRRQLFGSPPAATR